MTAATISQTKPYVLELEPGTYYWCRCGLSANQPFCDGAHSTTDLKPVRFQIEEKKWSLCADANKQAINHSVMELTQNLNNL